MENWTTLRLMIPGIGTKQSLSPSPELSIRVRHALIVDEALPIRRKLLEILHRAGLSSTEVGMAESAEQAMEVFALEHPTLVFCELVGAPERGLEMILEMLQLDPQAKIVLVTAEDVNGATVRQAIRAGAFGVVKKPLRHEAIRQILSEIEAEEGGIERYR